MKSATLKKICFISLKSYDLLSESTQPSFIGGAERQQVLVGRGLRELGYQVGFITLGKYGAQDTCCGGIRVLRAYDPDRGVPGLRALTPRWSGLWSAMRRADADIYHQMCADIETGQVAWWCQRHGRKFIFSVASDADCNPGLPLLETRRQRWFYRYGLRRADRVITQTTTERNALKKSFGVDSTIIPSCTRDAAQLSDRMRRPNVGRATLVWVSRIVPPKRLDWLLDVAERCPQHDFVVVGGGNESTSYVRDLLQRARRICNVKVLGRISDAELWELYARTDLLLDTAAIAGVPTTFLEAWAHAVPVISTVELGGILERNNLGRVVSSVEEMVAAIDFLLGDIEKWLRYSNAARTYYEKNHTVETVCTLYHQLFQNMYPCSPSHVASTAPSPRLIHRQTSETSLQRS